MEKIPMSSGVNSLANMMVRVKLATSEMLLTKNWKAIFLRTAVLMDLAHFGLEHPGVSSLVVKFRLFTATLKEQS